MKARDYIKLAQAIKENTYNENGLIFTDTLMFIMALCDILAADNPKFDKVKFMEACE